MTVCRVVSPLPCPHLCNVFQHLATSRKDALGQKVVPRTSIRHCSWEDHPPEPSLAADGPRSTGRVVRVPGADHWLSLPLKSSGLDFISSFQLRPSPFLLKSLFVSFSPRIPFKIGQPKKQIVPKTVSNPILSF